MKVEDLMKLLKDYKKDAWGDGEHNLGHKDRLILTVDNL